MLRSKPGLAVTQKLLSFNVAVSPWGLLLPTKPGRERFSAKSIGLDRRAQLPSPSFDNGVTITGCSLGPRIPYRRGVSPTEALSGPIPWHCLRIFLMRDTGSHQRVFAI